MDDMKKETRICEHCGKALRLIGATRKNGKQINNGTGKDWKSRKYHKKCFKELKRK